MPQHRAPDPLSVPCPVCRRGVDEPCLAVDYVRLPTPHPERTDAPSSTYDLMMAGWVTPDAFMEELMPS